MLWSAGPAKWDGVFLTMYVPWNVSQEGGSLSVTVCVCMYNNTSIPFTVHSIYVHYTAYIHERMKGQQLWGLARPPPAVYSYFPGLLLATSAIFTKRHWSISHSLCHINVLSSSHLQQALALAIAQPPAFTSCSELYTVCAFTRCCFTKNQDNLCKISSAPFVREVCECYIFLNLICRQFCFRPLLLLYLFEDWLESVY